MMHLSLLVFVSIFLVATADQNDNEIGSENVALATSSFVGSDTPGNNQIGANSPVDTNSFVSFSGDPVDSNDGGHFSVADACDNALNSEESLESDSTVGQAFGDSSVKSRRDGTCYIRDPNSEFVLPGDKPTQRENFPPPIQHGITNERNPTPPVWTQNCLKPYTYALCCSGEHRRIDKRQIRNGMNVETCIWVLYNTNLQMCTDPRKRWCCEGFPPGTDPDLDYSDVGEGINCLPPQEVSRPRVPASGNK